MERSEENDVLGLAAFNLYAVAGAQAGPIAAGRRLASIPAADPEGSVAPLTRPRLGHGRPTRNVERG
jgi:hypothetical protein